MTNKQRRLYRAYLTFRQTLHNWLYGVTVNECSCRDHYRSKPVSRPMTDEQIAVAELIFGEFEE